MHENRNYLIIPVSEIPKIDFLAILETSKDTLRKSVDGTKTLIKWNEEQPTFIADVINAEGPYVHEDILEILNTIEWSAPMEEI